MRAIFTTITFRKANTSKAMTRTREVPKDQTQTKYSAKAVHKITTETG